MFGEEAITINSFIVANTFGLELLVNTPHSFVLATFRDKKETRINVIFQVLQVLNCTLIQITLQLLNCRFTLRYSGIPAFLVKAVAQNKNHDSISLSI